MTPTLSVACWSLSFYPQPITNYARRSLTGLSLDFPTINLLGFLFYLLSTSLFLLSPLIREQYAVRHPHSPISTVRYNDLFFAIHAVLLSSLYLSQFFVGSYTRERAQRHLSRPILGIGLGCVTSVVGLVLWVLAATPTAGLDARGWAWIDVVYGMGYAKLVITLVKYTPQFWLNYRRKSTVGWSIYGILLDLVGGVLSLVQLTIDAGLQEGGVRGVVANPMKLGLSLVSIAFDAAFCLQHYLLYPGGEGDQHRGLRGKDDEDEERERQRPLLSVEREARV